MLTKIRFLFGSSKMCLYRATLDRAGQKSALLKFPAFCYAFQITCIATKPEEKRKKIFKQGYLCFPIN